MPKFTTVSPTHIAGKKHYAWEGFRDGGYVAIGWLQEFDLSGMSKDAILELIRREEYYNESEAIHSFDGFLALEVNDYVAVNNVNHGLFGVGLVESCYLFEALMHDCGSENTSDFYSHYRKVRWVRTDYVCRSDIILDGETSWEPRGTVGCVQPHLPPYIVRWLGALAPGA
jgi:hypothetical protein